LSSAPADLKKLRVNVCTRFKTRMTG
jgi:hypothetical protein